MSLSLSLSLLLSHAVREALALSEQEGGFGDLTYGSKGRAPYCGEKYVWLENCRLIRLTHPPSLPRWLALSEQEGGFGDLTYGSKGRYPSWEKKSPLYSGPWCPLELTPPPPLPGWLVLALELLLLLAVREAPALSEKEGDFKELNGRLGTEETHTEGINIVL